MAFVVGVASVGGVRSVPGGGVHGADLTLRDTILQQDVGVDKSAAGAAIQVLLVVGSGLLTVTNAALRVKLGLVGNV